MVYLYVTRIYRIDKLRLKAVKILIPYILLEVLIYIYGCLNMQMEYPCQQDLRSINHRSHVKMQQK